LLINEKGDNIGETTIQVALDKAAEIGLDLVQVGEDSGKNLPVCKLIDYGKYQYKQSKQKKSKNSSKQLKEIVIKTMKIADNDLRVKMKKVRDLLEKSHKVKITIRMKGRENHFTSLAREKLQNAISEFEGIATHDGIRSADRSMYVTLIPV